MWKEVFYFLSELTALPSHWRF